VTQDFEDTAGPFDGAQDRPFDGAQDRPFDGAQDRPGEEPGREHRYKYNAGLDPTGGRVGGLNARLRSQGRDHIGQLDAFYDQGLISEVLYLVSIGKEASVYCCSGGRFLAGRQQSAGRIAEWSEGDSRADPTTPPQSSFPSTSSGQAGSG